MHAIDRLARTHVLMQRLQHQSIAAQRHHDVGVGRIVVAVKLDQLRQRLLGLGACARDEGDPVISLGTGHGIASSYWRERRRGAPGSSIRPWPCLSRWLVRKRELANEARLSQF